MRSHEAQPDDEMKVCFQPKNVVEIESVTCTVKIIISKFK